MAFPAFLALLALLDVSEMSFLVGVGHLTELLGLVTYCFDDTGHFFADLGSSFNGAASATPDDFIDASFGFHAFEDRSLS